jgi:hypothetical protein
MSRSLMFGLSPKVALVIKSVDGDLEETPKPRWPPDESIETVQLLVAGIVVRYQAKELS